jgi:hypothetical protein
MIRPEVLARSDVADLDQTRDFFNSIHPERPGAIGASGDPQGGRQTQKMRQSEHVDNAGTEEMS